MYDTNDVCEMLEIFIKLLDEEAKVIFENLIENSLANGNCGILNEFTHDIGPSIITASIIFFLFVKSAFSGIITKSSKNLQFFSLFSERWV